MDADLVRCAHADAWEAHGRYRAAWGGGAARLPGIRLMASGLPHPQWNNGDILDPSTVDIEAVRRWFADHDVPWGVRVPAGMTWPHGRRLFRKRLMGLRPADHRSGPVQSAAVRVATAADLESVLAVVTVAFQAPDEVERPWLAPLLSQPGVTVAVAEVDREIVGVGHVLCTGGDAGPAAYVAGIGVLPTARRRGIATVLSSWLVDGAFDAGARLAHLHPDTDEAARVYARLGFVEVDGFDVYVEN